MGPSRKRSYRDDLLFVAAASGVFVGVVALAALGYLLLDILVVAFLGIVVAAALQPLHHQLCRLGLPKPMAGLVLYAGFLGALVSLIIVVAPVLVEEASRFATTLPDSYATLRLRLMSAPSGPVRLLGQRLPPFEQFTRDLVDTTPDVYWGVLGMTTSLFEVLVYFISVLAVGFYWTMELPRFERVVLSLLPVARRVSALNTWHEIEYKLGASVRGQGIAMLMIGVLSAIGYTLIGLPNVLALSVLAGLLEGVPMIGPILAAIPAVIVALPLGMDTVLLVVAFAIALQAVESNVLLPKIMNRTVGVSSLGGILAILAFGTLYGPAGVLIAIPVAAVLHVLFETLVAPSPEPFAAMDASSTTAPWPLLQARIDAVRQQTRDRIRARQTRMGIDPESSDHVVDAVDQQIEAAAERVGNMIEAAQETSEPHRDRQAVRENLEEATALIERALARVAALAPPEPAPGGASPGVPEVRRAALEKTSAAIGQALEKAQGLAETETPSSPDAEVGGARASLEGAAPSAPGRG